MRQWLELTSEDRVLAITTISFDIAGLEYGYPSWSGHAWWWRVGRKRPTVRACATRSISRYHFLQATGYLAALAAGGLKGKSDLQIVCTGEAMPGIGGRAGAHRAPPVEPVWPHRTTSGPPVPGTRRQPAHLIGRPVANTQCYILDENGHPVPVGVLASCTSGEMASPGLSAATGAHRGKILPDPFRSQPGARMYRTGDLARYRADGNIECLGRTDHQVKIRGLRLELGKSRRY